MPNHWKKSWNRNPQEKEFRDTMEIKYMGKKIHGKRPNVYYLLPSKENRSTDFYNPHEIFVPVFT